MITKTYTAWTDVSLTVIYIYIYKYIALSVYRMIQMLLSLNKIEKPLVGDIRL